MDHGIAVLGLLQLPGLCLLDVLHLVAAVGEGVVLRARLQSRIGIQKGANFGAEGCFFGAVVEVHVSAP